ncbi:cyclodeaminase/cyclohydrolase family protein [Shewanella salipaludis]|uniref:Cyclodeaminase/cyclohydrolase family protein n=1 Tax=Shewanella salipaludis TaxID=2723052 RepID=A0A972FQW3_9GAMM|nr:cyclodeaminase/cyclohydrolase family protein [Shewanella salipaludis]NMH64503.1 cyclodeaminase/cyclohydrolase family protein [Shewanella salipaludis]
MEQSKLAQIDSYSLLELPTDQLLNYFGAGRASPGSGSAAALLAILSCKMIMTVCDISQKKDECRVARKEFGLIKIRVSEVIEPRLKTLFDADAKDFEEVIKLRKLRDNAADPKEKSKYSRQASNMLETATDYTFEIAEKSLKLMEYGVTMFEDGWHAIRGDSGVSISAALSAVMSCIFIINLNLKTLKKRKYSKLNIAKVIELQKKLQQMQDKAFSCVTTISSESIDAVQLKLKMSKF